MKIKTAFLATTALLAAGNSYAADMSVYGQVNKLIVSGDAGVDRTTAIVDNDTSSTRFGFKAQEQLANGMVVSGLLELESESNSSFDIALEDDEANEENGNGISERHSRIGLGTQFGTFLIGKTSESTDGIAELDLGGVQDVMMSDITLIGGGMAFFEKDNTATNETIATHFSNFDGDRTNLVRYDSPIYRGLSGSASLSSGGDMALAAKYQGYAMQGVKVKAGLGYKNHESSANATVDKDIVGSASVLHEATGLAATVAYGERSFETAGKDDSKFMYTKLSYAPVGTNLEYAVDYAENEDLETDGTEVKSMGIGAQYNLTEGVSTSVMYREVEGEGAGISANKVDDIKLITAGLRVKF